MDQAKPSRTALRVAMRRAAHQIYDAQPLVFDDPIAVPILGKEYAEELQRTPGRNPDANDRPWSVGLRAFMVARSRYAEDKLAQAIANGVTQYVLLGAGLDTFAHRNPYASLHVFEVDHPATQQWKRELLQINNIAAPDRHTYIPVDFERQSLDEQLQSAGFKSGIPTFFSWLGVVPYLTLAAFRGTIEFVAAQPQGSGVALDYGQPREALPLLERLGHDSLAARVRQAGEPFQLFFTPSEIAAELAAFRTIEDLGSTEMNTRYFASRTDQLKLRGSGGRLLSAWI
jgi:methyltransferase (TIGR00027 family)